MPVRLRLLRLTPVEAVIECVAPPGAEIRGRLAGPTCPYSTTIEVAYHVRANRIVIPEPAWWDPQSPFLYRGRFEVWRLGAQSEVEQVQIGLRHTVHVDGEIVHNGRRLELKTRRVETADEATLRQLRQTGFNAVEVPAGLAQEVCQIADRIGLFVTTDAPLSIDPLRHPSAITS